MNNLTKILVLIIFFAILTMFTGVVSASNCTVNPEDPIQLVINNTPNDDAIRNNITDNPISDEVMVNTTGVVMSNTTSNCGPASLATVLQNLSINVSQDVLADVLADDAGTDENGTTMYGIAQAAQKQEVIVKGLKLAVNELRPWNIVYLIIDNRGHYSIVTSINNTIVYLADSDWGNINMSLADFTAAYVQNKTNEYGYALVITNNSSNPQLNNNNTLTDNEMKAIKGTGDGWTPSNPLIKALANKILRIYGYPRDDYSKGLAIWNWVTKNIHYHYHLNTWHSFNWVMIYSRANCCEMAKLVVCIARNMNLKARYAHKQPGYYPQIQPGTNHPEGNFVGHYWAQIQLKNGYWQDIDCTLLFFPPHLPKGNKYDARRYGGYMDLWGRFGGAGFRRDYPKDWEVP